MSNSDYGNGTALSKESEYRVAVFGDQHQLRYFYARTCRSLQSAGVPSERIVVIEVESPGDTFQQLIEANHATWFIQAGAWLSSVANNSLGKFELPLPSASRRPLCALGSSKPFRRQRNKSTKRLKRMARTPAIIRVRYRFRQHSRVRLAHHPFLYLAPQLLPELGDQLAQGTSPQ